MPYRTLNPADGRAPLQIRYGPFERSWTAAWIALAILFVFGLFIFVAGDSQTLTCKRASGGGTCELQTSYLFVTTGRRAFSIRTVRGVAHVSSRAGGVTKVYFHGSGEVLMFERAGRKPAKKLYRFFFEKTRQRRLDVSTWPSLWLVLFILPLGLFMGGGLMFGMLRRPSCVDLSVFGQEAVRVEERWAGIALRSRTLRLDDVAEVRVVRTKIATVLQPGTERPAALVSLIAEDGTIRPLSRQSLFGTDIHDQVAEELAAIIGCPVAHKDD